MSVKILNEENFDSFISSDNPVVVDFWADWCGPCKMMAPIFEKVSEEYAEKLEFGKLNVESFQHIANAFGIQSIPSLIIFRNRKIVGRIVGFNEENILKEKINSFI